MVFQIPRITSHLHQKRFRLGLSPSISSGEGPQAECRGTLQQALHLKSSYELHPFIFGPWRGRNFEADFSHVFESCFFQVSFEVIGLSE
jgi:hypothetical protein